MLVLQDYLIGRIRNEISECEEVANALKNSLGVLMETHANEVKYIVRLEPLGSREGNGFVEKIAPGNLVNAMESAESEFEEINNLSYNSAIYNVHVDIGGIEFPLPREYWIEFKGKNRSG